MTTTRKRRRGSVLMEFTLVTIPLIFLLISIFEVARGMWVYHTVAYAVQQGARVAIVHGELCTAASPSCGMTIGAVAQVIRNNAAGMDPNKFRVVLKSQNATQSCEPLSACLGNSAPWPPAADGHPGFQVSVSGTYPFVTPLSMFWPGSQAVAVKPVNLGAFSREEIRF